MANFNRNDILWRRMERIRKAEEIKAFHTFENALRNQVEKAVYGATSTDNILRKVSEFSIIDAWVLVYQNVGRRFAFMGFMAVEDIKQSAEIEQNLKRFVETNLVERIDGVTETTRTIMDKYIQEVVSEGTGLQKIISELPKKVSDVNKVRAARIARTEVISASNYGNLLGAQETGIKMNKVWISTRDSRTRDIHLDADGQSVDINGFFLVGGDRMQFPGDPSASAENVINCRCAIGYERV